MGKGLDCGARNIVGLGCSKDRVGLKIDEVTQTAYHFNYFITSKLPTNYHHPIFTINNILLYLNIMEALIDQLAKALHLDTLDNSK